MMKEGAGRAQRRMRGSSGTVPAISSTYDGIRAVIANSTRCEGTDDADAIAYAVADVKEVELGYCVSSAGRGAVEVRCKISGL